MSNGLEERERYFTPQQTEVDTNPDKHRSLAVKAKHVGKILFGTAGLAAVLYAGAKVANESTEDRTDCQLTVKSGDNVKRLEDSVGGSKNSELFTRDGKVLVIGDSFKYAMGDDGQIYERGLQPGDTVIVQDADPTVCDQVGGNTQQNTVPQGD